jgi:hypothetical protein
VKSDASRDGRNDSQDAGGLKIGLLSAPSLHSLSLDSQNLESARQTL